MNATVLFKAPWVMIISTLLVDTDYQSKTMAAS